MNFICPNCGSEIKPQPSMSPDYFLAECFGFRKIKVSRNKWKEVKCGYRDFIKVDHPHASLEKGKINP